VTHTHLFFFSFWLFVIYTYLVSVLYVAHCAYYCCCSLVSLTLFWIFMLLFVVIVIDYCVLIISFFFSTHCFNSWNDNNIFIGWCPFKCLVFDLTLFLSIAFSILFFFYIISLSLMCVRVCVCLNYTNRCVAVSPLLSLNLSFFILYYYKKVLSFSFSLVFQLYKINKRIMNKISLVFF
jgi:hypothetical protein